MAIEYLVREYEKTREDSWEFQKYQLESEIEKKRFAYENALYFNFARLGIWVI